MLRGRQAECAAIDALLEQIRRGEGGVLLLRGEPGIGKTALLEYAAKSARGVDREAAQPHPAGEPTPSPSGRTPRHQHSESVRVLRCTGYESESQVPFAGLHQALRPVLDHLPALAEPQRRALSGAFGLGEGPLDRFMIGAAVLSLLAEAAEQSPLLVLIDDAHWLDRASLDAWMFAARRLEREAVGVLIAARNEPGALDAVGLPEVELAGLPPDEAALLLDDLGVAGVAGVARTELVASTEGNPLALRELAAAGPMSYDGPVRLTDRLLQAFGRQLEALPPRTRRFLTLAAADDTGDLATIHRAAPTIGTSIADLTAAESAGLVREVMSFAVMVNRDSTASQIATELIHGARERGAVAVLPPALAQLSLSQLFLGRYRDALISGTEAVTLGRDTGQQLWAAYANSALAYLAAMQGEETRCLELTGIGSGRPGDERATGTQTRAALGLLDLGLGRIAEAYERLAGVQRGPVRHLSSVQRSVPDFVESAVRIGRADKAAEAMRRCETWAAVLDEPWTDALVLRCQALLAADEPAEDLYVAALKRHPVDERPFDRARTTLLYGEWLRRARRKADARHHLNTARQLFDQIDARPWADRAAGELAAIDGSTRQRTTPADANGLTPQELQIAELAATGTANRDIAAQLFLSPRTVAYHLYKAYPKLGIRSRAELNDVLAPR